MIRIDKLDLTLLTVEEVALIAHHGDKVATGKLWEEAIELAGRIANSFVRRYAWVDPDDLSQTLLLEFPKLLKRFRPEKQVVFTKYLYFSFYHAAQDALRREDPLGIQIPQKAVYPTFTHLSSFTRGASRITDCQTSLVDHVIAEGLERLEQGYKATKGTDKWQGLPSPRDRK
jgi:hypothetical protein